MAANMLSCRIKNYPPFLGLPFNVAMVYPASGRHDMVHPVQQLIVVSLNQVCSVFFNLSQQQRETILAEKKSLLEQSYSR